MYIDSLSCSFEDLFLNIGSQDCFLVLIIININTIPRVRYSVITAVHVTSAKPFWVFKFVILR